MLRLTSASKSELHQTSRERQGVRSVQLDAPVDGSSVMRARLWIPPLQRPLERAAQPASLRAAWISQIADDKMA